MLAHFVDFFKSLSGQLDGFVHPSAADDPVQRVRHKTFIAGGFFCGSAALVILPLHLALVGPASLAVTLTLAFMLGQWPLALFLAQSGNLDRAYGYSSAYFAVFLTGLCVLTGGLSSFALAWFVVVPMEAALSGNRRVILTIGGLCAVLIALLPVLPSIAAPGIAGTPYAQLLSASTACAYASVLALRLAYDQRQIRRLVAEKEKRWTHLNESTSEITCRCGADGAIEVIGGPLESLLDMTSRQARGNWLFQRLHVADRPMFLTALADARVSEASEPLTVRLRAGRSAPGEDGLAAFAWMEMQFRKVGRAFEAEEHQPFAADDLILTISEGEEPNHDAGQVPDSAQKPAEQNLEGPLADIVSYADLLCQATGRSGNLDREREYAERIHRSSLEVLQAVQSSAEADRLKAGEQKLSIEPVEMESVLVGCCALMGPIAQQDNVHIESVGERDVTRVPADRRALRQIVLDILSYSVRAAAPGGTVLIKNSLEDRGIVLEVSVTQKGDVPPYQPSDIHAPSLRRKQADIPLEEAGGLDIAEALVGLHDGELSRIQLADQGEVISVWLPAGARRKTISAEDRAISAVAAR